MKKRPLIVGLIVVVAAVALVIWGRGRIHFDFAVFKAQVARADWRRIGIAVGCIYFGYVIRAVRWALFLRHNKKVPLFSLIGTQVIGFTAVALIGRVADLARPYLVAKRTTLPLSSQIAVYIVERLFDAGSMALIFSIAMIWVPTDEILKAAANSGSLVAHLAQTHRELALLLTRYGMLVMTLLGALFLVVVRWAGGGVATFFERTLSPLSKKFAMAMGDKIRTFRAGLDTMRTFGDFAAAAGLSIGMWALITSGYFETCKAFVASPELAATTPSKCVLVMIASGGASIFQLPVIGWFSQIAAVVVALTLVLGAHAEAATACAAMLLLVTFLSIVPVGLIWARFENVSLRKLSQESEQAADVAPAEPVHPVRADV